MNMLSHPTRVRGLKHFLDILAKSQFGVAPHAGAWIETGKIALIIKSIGSHPTRVRGLKPTLEALCNANVKSHPTRVRGLKLPTKVVSLFDIWSHPTRVRGLKLVLYGRFGLQ